MSSAELLQLVERQKAQIAALQAQVKEYEDRISNLTGLVDKYQSVFCRQMQNINLSQNSLGDSVFTDTQTSAQGPRKRGIGISAEPDDEEKIVASELKRYPKPLETQDLIKRAILANDFLNNLAHDQLQNLIDCMYLISYKAGELLIKQGEYGDLVYVLSEGKLEVWKDGRMLREIEKGTVLGELAILYNCQRTATVKSTTQCQLWAIDRKSFQNIVRKKRIQRHKSRVNFLKSVPTFQELPDATLSQVADQLVEARYSPNEYVIRQGARGDNFYIICQGSVKVTMYPTNESGEIDNTAEPVFVRTMGRGEWFGEKALQGDHKRTANIIAQAPDGVICLSLDTDSYNLLIGDLESFRRQYADIKMRISAQQKTREEFASVQLEDITTVGCLGVGGFGRVDLVKLKMDETKSFALKKMKKCHIVQTRQQEHVLNERNIMLQVNCEFIVKLWKTYKDKKYVYMLMEACLGGELWILLRDQFFFTENATQFYVACVIEALDYLHKRNIIYRDLKPENLILDTVGYCKVTDFGFSKKIQDGGKTWTFCGTSEYMAPEVILNKGHDVAVDFWSLGILIFELLTGLPPFDTPDAMRTYSLILKGIDAIGFPPKISRNAQNLIKKLCRDNPAERLGYGKGGIREVEKHVWFEGFDWIGLQKGTLCAPFERKVSSAFDLRNFDKYPKDDDIPADETSGWDDDF